VLFKTGLEHYEDALIRDPGTMKLAQWGNRSPGARASR
jgi:hypothetical protein